MVGKKNFMLFEVEKISNYYRRVSCFETGNLKAKGVS